MVLASRTMVSGSWGISFSPPRVRSGGSRRRFCGVAHRLEQSKVGSVAKAAVALKARHLVEQTQLDKSLDHLVGGYESAVQMLFDHADW